VGEEGLKTPRFSMTQTWEIKLGNRVGKMGLCQIDNKFVQLRPLSFMANNLPARKIAGFGRLERCERDKTSG